MDRIPIKANPQLFDLAVSKIQLALGEITWLNYIFGICERLTDVKEGVKFHSANAYAGDQQYIQVMPCDELGNFAFFVLRDPQELIRRDNGVIKTPFSLIVWYDMRTIGAPLDDRNREAVKLTILNTLRNAHFSWVTWSKIYERPENVFSDFSYDYTNNQYLMSPYAGFRIEGEMLVRLPCESPLGET